MSDVKEILKERGKRYGSFAGHAAIAQSIKEIYFCHDNYTNLTNSQKEALDMIAHKTARILNGDPNYADSWVDIAGYAQLIVDELEEEDG